MRFPNESDEYRGARGALLQEEIELRRRSEAGAAKEHARTRGWRNVRLLSSANTTYNAGPGMHPRHVDFIWPVWSVFDCTPEGRGTDWFPQLAYR